MAPTLVEFAQQLKQQASIEQVVGDFVPTLKRSGRSFKGLCPFHDEKTPSFFVHPEFGFYRCFGCGAGGDVFKFIQETEKIDFRLAVESLAKRLGVSVPEFQGGGTREQRDAAQERRQSLLALCKLAEKQFADWLWTHPVAAAARDYLEGRGLTPDQLREYRIGFAPPEYEALLAETERRGYRPETAAEAGLAIRRDRGGFIDRFRNRIVFPIANHRGEVVGFGGRLLDGEGPKYLNSPETPIFRKGELLYGLEAARESIRDLERVILVEGYMDWIALHSHGVANVVAGLGTALAEGQARLLRRMTREVVLLYDGDDAGRKAMFRAAQALLAQDLTVLIAPLPDEHDPDSYIRERGAGATRGFLDEAEPCVDFFSKVALGRFDTTRPEGKREVAQEMGPLLRALADPILREGHVKQLAGLLGLQPETLWSSIRGRARRSARPGSGLEEAPPGDSPDAGAMDRMECSLLHRLIRHLGRIDLVDDMDPDLFTTEDARSIFSVFHDETMNVRAGGSPPGDWLALCNSEQQIRAMSYILLFEESQFDGRAVLVAHGRSVEEMAEECRRDIIRLIRRRKQRIARSVVRDLRLGGGGIAETRPQSDAFHAEKQSVLRDTASFLGAEES